MTSIPIAAAKTVATDYRCRGVLIVAFGSHPGTGEPTVQTVSYGHTRASCNALRAVNDRVYDLLTSGGIEVFDALQED